MSLHSDWQSLIGGRGKLRQRNWWHLHGNISTYCTIYVVSGYNFHMHVRICSPHYILEYGLLFSVEYNIVEFISNTSFNWININNENILFKFVWRKIIYIYKYSNFHTISIASSSAWNSNCSEIDDAYYFLIQLQLKVCVYFLNFMNFYFFCVQYKLE